MLLQYGVLKRAAKILRFQAAAATSASAVDQAGPRSLVNRLYLARTKHYGQDERTMPIHMLCSRLAAGGSHALELTQANLSNYLVRVGMHAAHTTNP